MSVNVMSEMEIYLSLFRTMVILGGVAIAFFALLTAIRSLKDAKQTAMEEKTIDQLMTMDGNEKTRSILYVLNNLKKINDSSIKELAEALCKFQNGEPFLEPDKRIFEIVCNFQKGGSCDDIEYINFAIKLEDTLYRWEMIATAIKRGVYLDKIIKDVYYHSFIELWEVSRDFIERRKKFRSELLTERSRSIINTMFQEAESLYDHWKKEPLNIVGLANK